MEKQSLFFTPGNGGIFAIQDTGGQKDNTLHPLHSELGALKGQCLDREKGGQTGPYYRR